MCEHRWYTTKGKGKKKETRNKKNLSSELCEAASTGVLDATELRRVLTKKRKRKKGQN